MSERPNPEVPPPPAPDEGQDHEGHYSPEQDKHPDDETDQSDPG